MARINCKNLFVTNGLDGVSELYFKLLVGRHGSDVQTDRALKSRTQCWGM